MGTRHCCPDSVLLMGNIKNRNIFDLCAAPGGKTAQMLNAGALVTALDISKERVLQLSNNIKRIGLSKNLKLKVRISCNIIQTQKQT